MGLKKANQIAPGDAGFSPARFALRFGPARLSFALARTMSLHVQLAQRFGGLIAREEYESAHKLLTKQAQSVHTVQEMGSRSEGMRRYAPGPFRSFLVMEEFMLEDWPAKQDGDVASIYISLEGDNCCEAVSVIVAQEDGDLRIRDLEWGRP